MELNIQVGFTIHLIHINHSTWSQEIRKYSLSFSSHIFSPKIFTKTLHGSPIRARYGVDGLVQDCSNSIANALELLQSWTKPSVCPVWIQSPIYILCVIMILWYGNTFCITGPLWGESTIYQRARIMELWCQLEYTGEQTIELSKLGNKQSNCQWSEMPWRLYDITEMKHCQIKVPFLNWPQKIFHSLHLEGEFHQH